MWLKKWGLTLLILSSLSLPALADSPITSTQFYEVYLDIPIVKKAREAKVLDLEMAQYLSNPNYALDTKAALINALSWDFDGKNNAILYGYYLGLQYGKPLSKLDMNQLSDSELMTWGYLTVMDDYFHPQRSLALLERAQAKNPNSYTIAMILALAKAQTQMEGDWCQIWRLTESVLNNPSLSHKMRPQAEQNIVDYMILYRDSCS